MCSGQGRVEGEGIGPSCRPFEARQGKSVSPVSYLVSPCVASGASDYSPYGSVTGCLYTEVAKSVDSSSWNVGAKTGCYWTIFPCGRRHGIEQLIPDS